MTARARTALALLLAPLILRAQYPYPRTRGSRGTTAPPGASVPKGVIIVFTGKLKVLDKKKIVIETEEGELLTFKLTGKTKFIGDGKTVKPAEIDLETPLAVDATQDPDASLLAVNVSVDKPRDEKPAAKQD
jgi:hypothetical protein